MKARKLIKTIKARGGWDAEVTKGNHIKFTHEESGLSVFAAATASDNRAEKNLMAAIRRVEAGGTPRNQPQRNAA